MTQHLTRSIALGLLLATGGLACGKYGPPVRTRAVQANAAAPSAAPAAPDEACEEDPEEKAP
jgi:hypothetical protein